MNDPRILPPDLPAPPDDGACRHLPGLRMPTLALPATTGGTVAVGCSSSAWMVLYCFPRASEANAPPPPGWGTGFLARAAAPRKPATSAITINT